MAEKAPTQPTELPPDEAKLRRDCDIRMNELRLERITYERQWRQISRFILPQRGRYLVPMIQQAKRLHGDEIIDPTGTKAHQKLAAFLMAGITNPSLEWFRLGFSDQSLSDNTQVKEWTSQCEKTMMSVLSNSSFYEALYQSYEEIGGFGTGPMLVLPDQESVVWFYPLTAGEYWLALDKRQKVDTLFREYSLTVSQMVDEFGLENCSQTVQRLFTSKRGLSQRFVIWHVIQPNTDRKQGKLGWRGAKWISAYMERNILSSFLRIEGFQHTPFIAPRWHALAGDAYGTGPGQLALPDVKMLQSLQADYAELIEKLARPPMQADDRHRQGYLGLRPGDTNWIAGLDNSPNAGIRPIYQVSPQVQGIAEKIAETQRTVQSSFFNDTIEAISSREGIQPLNEEEIAERRQEKLLILGPVLERFYNEALGPLIRIVFDIMNRAQLFPPPPDILHGKTIEPKFISVLAQAQKAVGTSGIEQLLKFVGSSVGAFPIAQLCLNMPEIVSVYGDSLNIPPKLIVPPEQVEAQMQAQQKQQQAQAAIQNMQGLAQGAQTLSQTNVGDGRSALGAMTGLQ